MAYRASDAAIKGSYEEIGEEIIPLMLRVIHRPLKSTIEYDKNSQTSDQINAQYLMHGGSDNTNIISKYEIVAVQKLNKVLAAFSLLPSAKYEMAHEPNFMRTLKNIIDITGPDVFQWT